MTTNVTMTTPEGWDVKTAWTEMMETTSYVQDNRYFYQRDK